MGDLQTRPFSKDYSGLINQSVIALGISLICVSSQELMRRKRRGKPTGPGLGSRESWEFGYLYNGRSWARYPSPPSPGGWPLGWIRQILKFSEEEMSMLRGLDATLYVRFLRGCSWFTLLHSLTTFPILFPIHVKFSDTDIPSKSMTRVSISSLVGTERGLSLLWVHICLLFWITISWMCNLVWICNGAFKLRAHIIDGIARKLAEEPSEDDVRYYPHPHPQYGFTDIPSPDRNHPNTGLRLRTVMVSNVPSGLRSEKELQEYFEYYMSRPLEKPSMGLTSSVQPGFLNKSFAFLFNRAKRIPAHPQATTNVLPTHAKENTRSNSEVVSSRTPVIERVVIARKMSDLASLLERREDTLRALETAHIKLAYRSLHAAKEANDRQSQNKPLAHGPSRSLESQRRGSSDDAEANGGSASEEEHIGQEERMRLLTDALIPYVAEFDLKVPLRARSKHAIATSSKHVFRKLRMQGSEDSESDPQPSSDNSTKVTSGGAAPSGRTIWDALLSLPRHVLDAYQPLIRLENLFHGKTVPTIDYYTTKLTLLNAKITENRARATTDFPATSTAFVTFADPADARRACKYLAVHPANPLACLVTPAPMYQEIDWYRIMKSSLDVEFVKDWVVNLGVWGFTLFWLFPVSLLVGLVSIDNISLFWPSLKKYLEENKWESEVIQSFIPTVLVALLALLIPLVLLLIAKKAHTITTLSALHDRIMTRYFKFLIVNVLVFFCVGTAAMQSILLSLKTGASNRLDIIQVVADSFPTAGPFYVGWMILATALHNGFEIVLLGLPLIVYPTTKRQLTPRKRAIGLRPRTFNYYYWLPNHLLVIHIFLLFSTLNPVVIPFATIYFFVSSGVIKNQLLHIYAKHYEANGQVLLIRIVRYSLDGLILMQAVFLAYMVVLKKTANVGLAGFLIVATAIVKIIMTRMCRTQYELDDIREAEIVCGRRRDAPEPDPSENNVVSDVVISHSREALTGAILPRPHASKTWRLPAWVNFSYSTVQHRVQNQHRRQPIPFSSGSISERVPLARITSPTIDEKNPFGTEQVLNTSSPVSHQAGAMSLPPLCSLEAVDSRDPVVSHPPPIPWDDQATVDLPYDNPFYTRGISNVLWLPRNPCGILDLDDTIDLKIAITVDPIVGHLETWLGRVEAESPRSLQVSLPAEEPSSSLLSSSDQPLGCAIPFTQFDGTEDIDLPTAIARRVQAGEAGIESTMRSRRPSTFRRRLSVSEKSVLATIRKRPSTLQVDNSQSNQPRLVSYRSFSSSISRGRARSMSIMSTLHPPISKVRTRSTDRDYGLQPTPHAQPENMPMPMSQTSLTPGRPSRNQNVSTQQAIVHEVLAEEQQALAERLEEEEAEAAKAKSTKSWLISWMFRKGDN